MTREEVIKHLGTYSSTLGSGQTSQEQHEEAKRVAIENLEKTRWIPVTERLPEEDIDVLVTVVKCRHKVMYAKYDRQLQKFCVGNYIRSKYVTAWMPLPEPYKGGKGR